MSCYCKKTDSYENCCEPFILGKKASTPEELMRSRFSAFATANATYIVQTQIANLSTNIDIKSFTEELKTQKWVSLEVLKAQGDEVAFIASMLYNDTLYSMQETSRFIKHNDSWLYEKALSHESSERELKRNEACPCKSGKKYKQCCQKAKK